MSIFHLQIATGTAMAGPLNAARDRLHIRSQSPRRWKIDTRFELIVYPIDTALASADNGIYCHCIEGTLQSITLLIGHCFEFGQASRLWSAEDVFSRLNRHELNPQLCRADLGGDYSIIHIQTNGLVLAFGDACSMESLFVRQGPSSVELSNRIALLERPAERQSGFDFAYALSPALTAFHASGGTFLNAVRRFEIDEVLFRKEGEAVQFSKMTPSIYERGRLSLVHDQQHIESLLSQGIEQSIAWLNYATRNIERLDVAITGGKDSRAVVAMCVAAGLSDRIRLFTNGEDDHPEVIIGRAVADTLGLEHERRAVIKKPETALSDFFENIAVHCFQAEAMMSPWDTQNRAGYPRGINVGGLCGEYLRPFRNSVGKVQDDLRQIVRYRDPLGVISPDISGRICTGIFGRLTRYKEHGAHDSDMANLYHFSEAYSGWLSPALRLNAYAITTLKPLNNVTLNQVSFALPAEQRATEFLHYSIMEHCAEKLLDLPFFVQEWSNKLAAYGKTRGLNVKPLKQQRSYPVFGSWQHQLQGSDTINAQALALLNETRHSRFWEHVDRERFYNRLRERQMDGHQLHSAIGIFGALFKYESIELPRQMFHSNDKKPTAVVCLRAKNESDFIYSQIAHGRQESEREGEGENEGESEGESAVIHIIHPFSIKILKGLQAIPNAPPLSMSRLNSLKATLIRGLRRVRRRF